MTTKLRKLLTITFIISIGFLMPFSVSANPGTGTDTTTADSTTELEQGTLGICTFIQPICNALGISSGGENTEGQVLRFTRDRISQIVSLIFIGIIIISVFIIVQAGVKYIQSQGEEGKIAEAQKAIRSVFIGIAVLFVGIIGLILVLAFFNASGLIGTTEDVGDVFNAEIPEE